jgi:hypothetical protein
MRAKGTRGLIKATSRGATPVRLFFQYPIWRIVGRSCVLSARYARGYGRLSVIYVEAGMLGLPVSLSRYAAVARRWVNDVNTQLPGNGGVSGAVYWSVYIDVRGATPGTIPHRRLYRTSTCRRLSGHRFGGYSSRSQSLTFNYGGLYHIMGILSSAISQRFDPVPVTS